MGRASFLRTPDILACSVRGCHQPLTRARRRLRLRPRAHLRHRPQRLPEPPPAAGPAVARARRRRGRAGRPRAPAGGRHRRQHPGWLRRARRRGARDAGELPSCSTWAAAPGEALERVDDRRRRQRHWHGHLRGRDRPRGAARRRPSPGSWPMPTAACRSWMRASAWCCRSTPAATRRSARVSCCREAGSWWPCPRRTT